MLQSSESAGPDVRETRLAAFRAELKRQGLDGFIIPRHDEFQGEYVAPYAERLRWLTGFSGSWGMAIVLEERAAMFVDGRYTVQAAQQVDKTLYSFHHLIDEPPQEWLEKHARKDQVIGYDAWLLSADQASRFARACAKAGATLKAVEANPIDMIWRDRPPRPSGPVEVQPTQFAGRMPAEKLSDMDKAMESKGADAAVITLPDSIAWLFNIRGQDVRHTPVVHAQAILRRSARAVLFIDKARLPGHVQDHLSASADVEPPDAFPEALSALGRQKAKVLVELASAPEKVRASLQDGGAEIVNATDPTILPKARKNAVECEGARNAHRRDGAAMARFLHWLSIAALRGGLSEIDIVDKLAEFRRATEALKDLSFETIAGTGPNAALPHYHVEPESSRAIEMNRILLVDSGGQYQDGTTDVTRTVIIGTPAREMKDRFTRVLKGMIAMSVIRFPKGTTGSQLDVLARESLWKAGLDYDHGTGHGVGSYLSVHEGPARLNKTDRTPLEPGMILSNEPGYYKPGEYGIRIENLLLVQEPRPIEGGERPMMGFETLTLVPIDRALMEVDLLTAGERAWIDAYHTRVRKEIGPLLEGADRDWLEKACAPLG
jgi:Xaa-Pro aminopeptidase